jgi:hypothetical protein
MARVYFDSNVFSNLKKNETESFRKLNEYINRDEGFFSFFFSHAHILDKKKDKTLEKYTDLEFMETIVKDNYLSYHALDKISSIYLATPRQVFDDEDSIKGIGEDLNDFFLKNIFSNGDELFSDALKPLFDTEVITTPAYSSNENDSNNLSFTARLFQSKTGTITVGDLLNNLVNYYHDLFEEGSVYKELRNSLNNDIKTIPIIINDNTYLFKELFSDNYVQDKFIELVKDTLGKNADGQIYYYDFYLRAYCMLDMLGYHKDKVNKKNTFNNLFIDSLHSYYARYCDYLITDDAGLLAKSAVLYQLFEVSAKVMSVDNFLSIIDTIDRSKESTLPSFFEKIKGDLMFGEIINKTEREGVITYSLEPKESYFGYFNKIFVVKNNTQGFFVIVEKERKHHLDGLNYRECKMIIKIMGNLFGNDIKNFGDFDLIEDVKKLNSKCWEGRCWEIGDACFYFQSDKNTNDFFLQIGPFYQWSPIARFFDSN